MTSTQFRWAGLVVLAVSGLVGGALGSWLLPSKARLARGVEQHQDRATWAQEQAGAVPGEVVATRFRLVDAAGKGRAALEVDADGGLGLRMYDATGKLRTLLGLKADGSPGLRLWDAAGELRGSLGILADSTVAEPPATADSTVAELLTLPRDLNLLYERKDLSGPQRVDVLVGWLAQERANPSPPRTGFAGGRVDSGYIQAQLGRARSGLGDAGAMTELVESGSISDEGVRDGLICALGLMGDASRIPRLLEILETHEEGDFRALAAKALGNVGAVEARKALNRALTDPFAVQAGSDVGPRHLWIAYPVREGAAGALRQLNSEQAMAKAQHKRETFAKAVKPHPASSPGH